MNSQTIISKANSQPVLNETPNFPNTQVSLQTSVEANVLVNAKSLRETDDVSLQQARYANILQICSGVGIGIMLITFLIYMSGLLPTSIKPSELPLYWGMNVHQYAQATNAPGGWDWLGLVNRADYLGLVGLAFLGIVSMLGYVSLLPGYLRKKDFTYVVLVGLEIIVISLAASGLVQVGA